MTHVELTWTEKKIEYWIRFGREAHEQILDRRRRVVSFRPNTVFAFVRWAANDFGTTISRIDIVRAVQPGERYQTLPFVRPGGEILLKIDGWPKVEDVLRHVDAIEAIGIEADAVSPEHWQHVSITGWPQAISRAPTRSTSIAPSSCAGGSSCDALWTLPRHGVRDDGRRLSGAHADADQADVERVCQRTDRLLHDRLRWPFEVTDLVAVDAPEPLATFLAERGYLPKAFRC